MDITIELHQLQSQLERINAPVLKYFNPGLSEREVMTLFKATNLTATEDLKALYQRRNGMAYQNIPSGKLSFGVNGGFFPLDTSIEMYQQHFREQFPFFFPIFWDDSFLISLDSKSADYGKVFIYSPSLLILEPQSCFDSLAGMIKTFSKCFETGIFGYDDEEFFTSTGDRYWDVMKKMNPNSEYWK